MREASLQRGDAENAEEAQRTQKNQNVADFVLAFLCADLCVLCVSALKKSFRFWESGLTITRALAHGRAASETACYASQSAECVDADIAVGGVCIRDVLVAGFEIERPVWIE